jgi:hypothetical protein
MEFTPNSCSSKCLEAPIYRLGVRMGVRQNKPVSLPDGEPRQSGRTTVRQDFPKFSQTNLSCIRTSSGRDGSIIRTDARPLQVISIIGFARPDKGAGASGRLNFNTQFPYLMRVRPNHERETSGRLKSNRQFPYTMHQRPDHNCQTSGRSNLNCDSCLMEIRVRTVYHIVRTVDCYSLSWNLERIREPFEN